MSRIKHWSKLCVADADLAAGGDDDRSALTALAIAAVGKLLSDVVTGEDVADERAELKRIAKSLRRVSEQIAAKQQRQHQDDDESTSTAQQPRTDDAAVADLDLGQYAHTTVFAGDKKKLSRFARLMGGGKRHPREDDDDDNGGGVHQHATYAPSEAEQKALEAEIEAEFDAARTHHGKKGLGAK